MEIINVALYITAIISILISVISFLYIRKKEKSNFQIMDKMLDSAINNSFNPTTYDETRLSSLASKLNRFLIISNSSRKNIDEERTKIKELVSDISHQTKTPIANILLYAQLLQEQNGLSEQAQKLTGEILIQSEKLSFLIQSLVKLSRLETGIISMNPIASSIDELINNSVKAVRQKVEEKNTALKISTQENMKACFDPKWTEEAIINILDNAAKYTQNGGMISISTTKYELFTRIDIKDNGIGIEKNEINQIFQRFYRSQAVNQHEGVGIGLYLAREIISAEGGYIKVISEEGKGSTFSVFLPNVKTNN